MKSPKTKVSALTTEVLNRKYWGQEPGTTTKSIATDTELLRAYSWHNSCSSTEDARNWLIEFTKANHPKKVEAVKALTDNHLNKTMGWVARFRLLGLMIPQKVEAKLDQYVNSIAAPQKKERVETEKREQSKLDLYLPTFEEALDKIDPEFSAYAFLISNNVAQTYAQQIAEYYLPVAQEFADALYKRDPQIVEAFKRFKRAEIAIQAKYAINIVNDCVRYIGNAKKARKPRKVKAKKVEDVLKHFTYMASHDKLQIKSKNPTAIIGASTLITLNTSNNVMTVFVAKEGGFGINRTAITNYDEAKTQSKRVGKKLAAVINTVLTGGKKQQKSVLNTVSSEAFKSTDRINSQTVLLSILK